MSSVFKIQSTNAGLLFESWGCYRSTNTWRKKRDDENGRSERGRLEKRQTPWELVWTGGSISVRLSVSLLAQRCRHGMKWRMTGGWCGRRKGKGLRLVWRGHEVLYRTDSCREFCSKQAFSLGLLSARNKVWLLVAFCLMCVVYISPNLTSQLLLAWVNNWAHLQFNVSTWCELQQKKVNKNQSLPTEIQVLTSWPSASFTSLPPSHTHTGC